VVFSFRTLIFRIAYLTVNPLKRR